MMEIKQFIFEVASGDGVQAKPKKLTFLQSLI